MIKHIWMSIEWLKEHLKNLTDEEKEEYAVESFNKSYSNLWAIIIWMQVNGYKYIPSEWCDNYDKTWLCKWHN